MQGGKTTPALFIINMVARPCYASVGLAHPGDVYYGETYYITPTNTKIKLEEPTGNSCKFVSITQVSVADTLISDINM